MHRIFDLTWFTTHWREIAKWPVALLLSWLRGKRWPLIYPPLLAINVVWCRAPQQGPPSWFVLWWHLSVKAISITPATKCWHAVYLAGIGVVGCTQEISRVIPGRAPRGGQPWPTARCYKAGGCFLLMFTHQSRSYKTAFIWIN